LKRKKSDVDDARKEKGERTINTVLGLDDLLEVVVGLRSDLHGLLEGPEEERTK